MYKKMTATWVMLLMITLSLTLLSPMVLAQNYRFTVDAIRVNVYVDPDGTIKIIYDLTFTPDPGSHAIDFVDVGMPNDSYHLSDVRASINGVALSNIEESPYVKPGVAIGLGSQAIQPGQTGTLHVEATAKDLIFQDSKDSEYASFVFSPTWFDGDFVHGTTYLEVNFYLPPGMTGEEPRYHSTEFTSARFADDRVVYTWIDEAARGDKQYTFGASFPQKYVAAGVVQKAPAFNLNLGGLMESCCSGPLIWIFLFGGGWFFLTFLGKRSQQKRRMKYMPPALSVEGTGVKRGLTAIEAAILLEAPLNKVVAMILFGLVKKGIVIVESDNPLKLTAVNPLPNSVKLWYYERRFLQAIQDNGTVDDDALREMTIDLIGDVNKKMTGFSRQETKTYYKDIAARAWKQVEAADTPEVLGERWGDGFEWTMLEDDWQDRTREVFRQRPVVMPHWWWYYRPWSASTSSARPSMPAPAPSGGGAPVTLPTLPGADFANTVVSGVESAAGRVVGSVEKFTGSVTQKTNPPPASSSSSSRGGGYSCACACACAGCACACAGGGR